MGITQVTGEVAHRQPDTGPPVKIGGRYQAAPAAAADLQRVDALFDAYGRLITGGDEFAELEFEALAQEDAPAADDQVGWVVLGIRKDAGGTRVDADGDFATMLFTSGGELLVSDTDLATQITGLANSANAEDTLSDPGDYGVAIIGRRSDADVVATDTEGDWTHLALDRYGRLLVSEEGSPATLMVEALAQEDAPFASDQVGWFMLGVRNDARAALTDTDLDYSPIAVDSAGRVLTRHGATTLGDGRKTVTTAGTRVALAATTAASWVIVQAETDNTNPVTVGGATVVGALATRQGIALDAGESVTLEIDDLADVYVDSITNTEGVTFVYGV